MKEFLSREGHAFLTKNVGEVNGRAIKGVDEPALRHALAAPSES